MRRKIGLILIGFVLVVFTIMIISIFVTPNKVKYYMADVYVDKNGNITVEETVVIDYKSYDNYLFRDIKYGKNHRDNPLFEDVDSSLYINDKASFDETSVKVEVWRGDIIDEFGLAKDITDQVKIGYSYNGDRDKYGDYIECYPDTHNCESLYVDATNCGSLDGLMSFRYTYTISDMVTVYNDCAEINYILFEYFEYKVKTAAVTFYLPNSVLPEEDFYCYGHGISNGKIRQYGNQKFEYVARNIADGDVFECRVVFPKQVISEVDEKNIVNVNMKDKILSCEKELSDQTNLRANIAIFMNVWTIVVGVLMVLITIRVYKKYDKEFIPKFDKEYLRELPTKDTPAEVGYLYYFEKTNDEDVTATLLDLIRRGYLELEYLGSPSDDKPNFIIKKNENKINTEENLLKAHEKQLIKWFIDVIGNGSQVNIQEIQDYGKSYSEATKFQDEAKMFMRNVKAECNYKDWFIDTSVSKMNAYLKLALPMITVAIMGLLTFIFDITFTWNYIFLGAIVIVYAIYVASIKKRSVNGNEEYAQWCAFKKFLEDFGDFKDYPMPGIVVWEEFLVYATTFKIADKVMKQLEVKLPDVDSIDNDSIYYGGTYMHPYFWHRRNRFIISHSMNQAMSSARTNSISSIAAHNAKSSGGGHGGGFSGGRSFGGGGGGFRGGR